MLFAAALAGSCAPLAVQTPAPDNTAKTFHLSASAVVRPKEGAANQFRFIWRRTAKNGRQDFVHIKDPFGITRAQFTQTSQQSTIDFGNKKVSDKDANALMTKILGYPLPVDAFGYWIVGVAEPFIPATIQRSHQGEIVEIAQHNWIIRYTHRDQGKPQQITLTAPQATIHITIKEWLTP